MLSILITHYNRPEALKSCLEAIEELKLDIEYEVVVSDDGSEQEKLEVVKGFNIIDKLVTASENQGLATNLNKGIRACKGKYILYCQEDFLLRLELKEIFKECMDVLDQGLLDMVRLRANYKFKRLIKLTENVYKIPKFSLRNFNLNTFQYSDHPFLTTKNFFEKYGYYLDNTSGPYGETEYAIRILNSDAIIGIASKNFASVKEGVPSVMRIKNPVRRRKSSGKKIWRIARALRQHLEWILYNRNKRRLYTYKNRRA